MCFEWKLNFILHDLKITINQKKITINQNPVENDKIIGILKNYNVKKWKCCKIRMCFPEVQCIPN